MLRVIAGIYGGRKLEQPDLKITRPTTDRIKEAIFSALQFKLKNKIFLDLFSGSGSIAIEAISRGAMKSFAIEYNQDTFTILKNNIDRLKINNIESLKMDSIQFLENSEGKTFDFIYIDPPFNLDLYNISLELIVSKKLLAKNGLIIIETTLFKNIIIPPGLLIQKSKTYGKSNILFISLND